MRYQETREQSAELLRMVLPLMSRHAAAFTPLSYAVWYEYTAGYNLGLKSAMDALLAERRLLNDSDIQKLFDEFVAHRDIESSMRVRMQIQKVIEQVSEATTQASSEVTQYTRGLSEYRHRLQGETDPESLAQLVDGLLDNNERVRERTDGIQRNLQDRNQEVVRLREELQMAQGLALRDPLTGLLNRRGFELRAQQLGDGGLRTCSVLIIDIDHFKLVNDTHGHLLGDRVIAAVGAAIRSTVGERGESARIGGEEFAVLLTSAPGNGAVEVAELIRQTVENGRFRRQDRDNTVGGVTVSIGIATHADGELLPALMERADRALYKSKQDGRNRITLSTGATDGQG